MLRRAPIPPSPQLMIWRGWLRAQRRLWRNWLGSWCGSLLIHAALLIALALISTVMHSKSPPPEVLATTSDADANALEGPDEIEQPLDANLAIDPVRLPPTEFLENNPELGPGQHEPAPRDAQAQAAAAPGELASATDRATLDLASGSGLEGRGAVARAALVRMRGGTGRSEEAVIRGLRWLAAHQRPDGSWRFDHRDGPCRGQCNHPGDSHSTTGATALALLPFLGAGYTHLAGEFQQPVHDGLYYLMSRMAVTPEGGDLQEGTMYAQGLATIALCEAYAMTADRQLEQVAQRALNFIVFAQDKGGGGWRYFPGQLGDLSVTGWQFMALKSGQLAYLRVPPATIRDALRFLDQVSADGGALYGYRAPSHDEPTMTAVGLLCRMYSGWKRENSPLARGVETLARRGPSKINMYHNFYATQVLHHWEGPLWERWNAELREYLIDTQADQGHESGSWFFPATAQERDDGQTAGGRLYFTSLAVLTLEVYYRHMPLYTRIAFGDF